MATDLEFKCWEEIPKDLWAVLKNVTVEISRYVSSIYDKRVFYCIYFKPENLLLFDGSYYEITCIDCFYQQDDNFEKLPWDKSFTIEDGFKNGYYIGKTRNIFDAIDLRSVGKIPPHIEPKLKSALLIAKKYKELYEHVDEFNDLFLQLKEFCNTENKDGKDNKCVYVSYINDIIKLGEQISHLDPLLIRYDIQCQLKEKMLEKDKIEKESKELKSRVDICNDNQRRIEEEITKLNNDVRDLL